MTAPTAPASIEVWEDEKGYVCEGLDLDYIDGVAADLADSLFVGASAEACYQPGDGTRYSMIFVPLRSLQTARPRVKDGREWQSRAVDGMGDKTGGYDERGYFVSITDHACYPIRLGPGRTNLLASTYVAEHWKQNRTSSVSITILFRAVAYHLDRLAAEQPHLRD